MRDGRGGARPRLASSGGLPGPTHRTAPVNCSPPGNKGTSLTRSGCHVGPAGRSPLWPLSTGPLLRCVPWEPAFSCFCPWGLTVIAPFPGPGRGCGTPSWPHGPASQGRAGPGPSPGHREPGTVAHAAALLGAGAGAGGQARGSEGRAPSPPGWAVPQPTPGTFSVTCAQRAPSPGTSLLPRSQWTRLTARPDGSQTAFVLKCK